MGTPLEENCLAREGGTPMWPRRDKLTVMVKGPTDSFLMHLYITPFWGE